MRSMSASLEASPLDCSNVAFDCSERLIQLGLTTAGDENTRALGCEALGNAQADARAAASYHCYFVFKFSVHKLVCFVCRVEDLLFNYPTCHSRGHLRVFRREIKSALLVRPTT